MAAASKAASEPAPDFVRYSWMVRPCEMYREEYRDCKSFRGRFHQQFTTGVKKECMSWKEDYVNCLEWTKTLTAYSALQKILANENKRMAARISGVLANDVWTLRESPREDWNDPLPAHLAKLNEGMKFKQPKAVPPKPTSGGDEECIYCGESDKKS